MLANEKLFQCRHPQCKKKPQFQVSDSSMASFVSCPSCNERMCTSCEKPWHSGLSCETANEQVKRQRKERPEPDKKRRSKRHERNEKDNEASERLISELATWCPRCGGPGWKDEDDESCDAMKCASPKCRHRYCYVCLCDYESVLMQSNSKHRPTCVHYRKDR